MNLSELKAIDSRLKRVAAGESIRDVYGMIAAEPGLDGVRMAKALYDPTPIDEAWLEVLGSIKGGIAGRFYLNGYSISATKQEPHIDGPWRFSGGCLSGKIVTTRGQLLFILLGLGVFDE